MNNNKTCKVLIQRRSGFKKSDEIAHSYASHSIKRELCDPEKKKFTVVIVNEFKWKLILMISFFSMIILNLGYEQHKHSVSPYGSLCSHITFRAYPFKDKLII